MEANSAPRHLCKLCNKSFPCGRSLGGHMRSHLTSNSAQTKEKRSRTKRIHHSAGSSTFMEEETDFEAGNLAGYDEKRILRKNPKKTQKLEFLDEDSSVQDKFCRECGKGFQSWKALFGHMKCHSSERVVSSSVEVEKPDSHITDAKQKLVMDFQSDNETEAPNRRKRSRRRRTRYMGTANSSSFSFLTDSSSVSGIEQEQEVAVSLMMLSRDVRNWVGFISPTESSDNNSKFLEAPSVVESKTSVSKGKTKTDANEAGFSSEMFEKSSRKTVDDFLGSKSCKKSKRRSKFQCDICRKIFHSYQALGGHRASHKKLKPSFFFSTMAASEGSEEIDISPYPTAESKLSKLINNGGQSCSRIKNSQKYKCLICLKEFASGQALGGHKRSHLVNNSEAKSRERSEIEKQVPEMRGFLDLNLPAAVESKDHRASLKPWWAGSEQEHEATVGFSMSDTVFNFQ